MILQLAKTSPYLSGQWKLDVELHLDGGQPIAKSGECHVTPLSSAIPYTDSIKRPYFNYSLAENIKMLQQEIGDNFFRDVPTMKNDTVIYYNENDDRKFVDPYDHVYQCGLRRTRYTQYNKQFALLCPIWITDEDDIERYQFRLTITGYEPAATTAITYIELSDELKASIKKYLKGVSTDLLNINLDRNSVVVTGLEASTGTVLTKDVSYILESLLERERPVIETDSTLCQLLPSNRMIARQLINFNFVFNLSDIFTGYLADACIGKRWSVAIDLVKVGYTPVQTAPFRDLYTNYVNIPSYIASQRDFDESYNALDYLEDNHCADFVLVNKTTQPNFHWALVENPNYLYNLYNGLSPLTINGDKHKLAQGIFFDQPDPYIKKYLVESNTANWCKHIDIRSYTQSEQADMLGSPTLFNRLTKFKISPGSLPSVQWSDGIKMEYRKELIDESIFSNIGDDSNFIIYVGIVHVQVSNAPNFLQNIASAIGNTASCSYDGVGLGALRYQLTNGPTVLTLVINHSYGLESNPSVLDAISLRSVLDGDIAKSSAFVPSSSVLNDINQLVAVFKNYVYPWTIVFNKSLAAFRIDGPTEETAELDYYKTNLNVESRLYRYTGSLQPMFIDTADTVLHNFEFFRKKMNRDMSDNEYVKYNEYTLNGYQPKYPSIGFFTLSEPVRTSYTRPVLLSAADGSKPVYGNDDDPDGGREIVWYNDSVVYVMPEEFDFIISDATSAGPSYTTDVILGILASKLSVAYGISLEVANELARRYNIKTKYDYAAANDISNLSIDVHCTLK